MQYRVAKKYYCVIFVCNRRWDLPKDDFNVAIDDAAKNRTLRTSMTTFFAHKVVLRIVCDNANGITIPSQEFADDALKELYKVAAYNNSFTDEGRYMDKYTVYLIHKVEKSSDPKKYFTMPVSETNDTITKFKIDVKGWQKVEGNKK